MINFIILFYFECFCSREYTCSTVYYYYDGIKINVLGVISSEVAVSN